jgi:hypothetical protein
MIVCNNMHDCYSGHCSLSWFLTKHSGVKGGSVSIMCKGGNVPSQMGTLERITGSIVKTHSLTLMVPSEYESIFPYACR